MPDSEPYSFILHLLAAENGHKEMATILLDKGAAVDAKENDAWTPLHLGFRIHNPSTSNPQLLSIRIT